MSIFFVSCGQNISTSETQNPSTQEQTTQTSENSEVQVQESEISETEKILVTSSIIPLSSIANFIGGDYVEVNNIVPAGVSPHGFDLSARQMIDIETSEIVFMVGLDHIDGFLEKAVPEEKQIHLADGLGLLEASEHEHDEDEHSDDEHADEEHSDEEHADEEHDEEHSDEHSEELHEQDPHVWLGKENVMTIVEKVRDELSAIMPEQAEYFSENTESFKIEIEKVYNDFASETEGKTPTEFIVFHDAYNYLLQSIGMDENLKIPFSENVFQETGTAHMAELIEEVELHGVTHVFREPQFSDGNLQKFVDEYNLDLGTLDPLGTDTSANGYLDNIKNNLAELSNVYE
ncbi:metal ABC transporter substrate-binding protein [Candidatus Gracilibacteria bacterium]|nr:metal ABC transporter substrate-binding protein [Candidatus Gracilibacteria bacterium]